MNENLFRLLIVMGKFDVVVEFDMKIIFVMFYVIKGNIDIEFLIGF